MSVDQHPHHDQVVVGPSSVPAAVPGPPGGNVLADPVVASTALSRPDTDPTEVSSR